MNIEKGLISSILNEENIRKPIKEKITTKFFYGDKESNIYKFIKDYYAEYNKIPSIDTVNRYFPDFSKEELRRTVLPERPVLRSYL